MSIKVGDRVKLPGGGESVVLSVDEKQVQVQLDGLSTAFYPVDAVTAINTASDADNPIRAPRPY
jgi:preprotein translocase subunit YajC